MIILGVCNAHTSGASLIVDGSLVASVNEERFSRVKNQRIFPRQSIEYCCRHAGISISDIDYVACGAWGGMDEAFIPQCFSEVISASKSEGAAKMLLDRTNVAVDRDLLFKAELFEGLRELGFSRQQITTYEHHLSHAATAFYPSPFDDALVMTLDGRGDFKSSIIAVASRESGLKPIASTSMFNSLGAFYGFITRYLGFVPDRHEGKVTGLAAYGDPNACIEIFRSMIDFKDGYIVADLGRNYTPFLSGKLPELELHLQDFSKEDIAAGAQFLLEDIVVKYISYYLAEASSKNIALAGGVFGNVKLNQRIMEIEGIDNLYVFPQMGDGGNPFGGALLKLYELGGEFCYPLEHAYLGPGYTRDEVQVLLNQYSDKVSWMPFSEYGLEEIAKDLDEGVAVGLFSGRMEYGPRSLGARSIIARATEKSINNSLNERLNRTEFMPFAPVTLKEHAKDCYVGWKPEHIAARFMTICYECTDDFVKQSPATAHIDKTARPQVIDRKFNALYFDILEAYYNLTGIPTLINTSFNNHEEPIVCSPEDAIRSLLLNNVDYVVFEDFVVKAK